MVTTMKNDTWKNIRNYIEICIKIKLEILYNSIYNLKIDLLISFKALIPSYNKGSY